MVISTSQILALSAPTMFLLCSGGFVFAWRHSRSDFYPLALALAFFCIAIAVTSVILTWPVPPEWVKLAASFFYLGSALLLAYGILARIGGRFDAGVLISVALAAMAAQVYFGYDGSKEFARAVALNYGVGAILLIASLRMGGLRRGRTRDRMVYWVYLLFTLHLFFTFYFSSTVVLDDAAASGNPSTTWVMVRLGRTLFIIVMALTVLGAVMLDIIERLKLERNVDGLTQLHNRRRFEELGGLEVASGRNRPVSLLLCDIDYFKQVNDNYGHATGDLVLTEFAKILRHCARTTDIVGRFGGEEFIILLPATSPKRAVHVAQRIRTLLAATHFPGLPSDYLLTASFGVAGLRDKETLRDLFGRADALLYGAKADGRDRVILEGAANLNDAALSEIAA